MWQFICIYQQSEFAIIEFLRLKSLKAYKFDLDAVQYIYKNKVNHLNIIFGILKTS